MSDELHEQPAPGGDPQGARKSLMPADWDEALDGPWDDEYLSEEALAEGADIELIVEYLNKHLDPERTEQVRRRLEEDDAFRDLAAPLLLTWSIPKYLERHPRPAGELERSWDEFTRRAGFAHQKRKARRRRLWLIALAFFVVGLVGFAARKPLVDWWIIQRDFAVVPYSQGWIPLGDSIFVELTPDASVRASRESVRDGRVVILDGTARFRVLPLDSLAEEPRRAGLVVHTRAGVINAKEGEFRVAARDDTADVEVQRPATRRFFYFVPLPTAVTVRRDTTSEPLLLRELDRARLVRDRVPERFLAPTIQP
jgi:FecR protein